MGVKAKRGGGRRPSDRVLYVAAGFTNEQMAAREVERKQAGIGWMFAVAAQDAEEDARERREASKGTCPRCFAQRALNRSCFC